MRSTISFPNLALLLGLGFAGGGGAATKRPVLRPLKHCPNNLVPSLTISLTIPTCFLPSGSGRLAVLSPSHRMLSLPQPIAPRPGRMVVETLISVRFRFDDLWENRLSPPRFKQFLIILPSSTRLHVRHLLNFVRKMLFLVHNVPALPMDLQDS
jgi:hypothetical protein